MKKRYISIILLIIMALSFTGSAFAEDGIIDLSEIKNFEEIKEILKNYSTSFKTKEDAKEFWSSYWTHVFPPKDSIFNYDLNFDSVLLKNVMYYGYGSLVPRGEQKHDRYGEALYLGYTKDGRYVTNIEFNENPLSNPKIIKDTTKYQDPKIKWSGKVRPYQTEYNDVKKVGELYLEKNASDPDKEKCGRSVLERWAKNVVNRTPEFAGGKDFYTYFGGDLDKFLKAVTITVPPTSRNNGQAVVWFNTADGQTHRTYYIKPTEPVDIIAIQDGFKGTTIKPDGSISFTFDYKVNGLERVKGETSVNYLLTVPDKYLLLDNYNKLANELPKGSQIHRINTSVGISGIAVNIPVDIDWNLMDEYQTISFDFKTPIFNLEHDISNQIESIFIDDSGIQISGYNSLVGINIGHLDNTLEVFNDFKTTKGFKEYKEGAYNNNLILGGLNKYAIELALLGRDSKGGHLKIGEPLEYRVKENQKDLDITLTAFKAGDLTEDTKKTNVILYDEKGNEVIREEIELKGTTKPAEEVSKDLDIKLNIENLGKGEHKFYAVINSDFDLTKPDPITYEDMTMLENNKVEIKIIMPGEEDFELTANNHRIDLDKKGEIELSYNVNLKGTEKVIPTVVDLYKDDKLIDSKNISLKGGENTDIVFNVPVSEEGATSFYGVVRLTGGVQAFSRSDADKLIKDFVEEIKKNIFAGSKAKNNEGKEYQQMIEDTTRTGEYQVNDKESKTYGSPKCIQVTRYSGTKNRLLSHIYF